MNRKLNSKELFLEVQRYHQRKVFRTDHVVVWSSAKIIPELVWVLLALEPLHCKSIHVYSPDMNGEDFQYLCTLVPQLQLHLWSPSGRHDDSICAPTVLIDARSLDEWWITEKSPLQYDEVPFSLALVTLLQTYTSIVHVLVISSIYTLLIPAPAQSLILPVDEVGNVQLQTRYARSLLWFRKIGARVLCNSVLAESHLLSVLEAQPGLSRRITVGFLKTGLLLADPLTPLHHPLIIEWMNSLGLWSPIKQVTKVLPSQTLLTHALAINTPSFFQQQLRETLWRMQFHMDADIPVLTLLHQRFPLSVRNFLFMLMDGVVRHQPLDATIPRIHLITHRPSWWARMHARWHGDTPALLTQERRLFFLLYNYGFQLPDLSGDVAKSYLFSECIVWKEYIGHIVATLPSKNIDAKT